MWHEAIFVSSKSMLSSRCNPKVVFSFCITDIDNPPWNVTVAKLHVAAHTEPGKKKIQEIRQLLAPREDKYENTYSVKVVSRGRELEVSRIKLLGVEKKRMNGCVNDFDPLHGKITKPPKYYIEDQVIFADYRQQTHRVGEFKELIFYPAVHELDEWHIDSAVGRLFLEHLNKCVPLYGDRKKSGGLTMASSDRQREIYHGWKFKSIDLPNNIRTAVFDYLLSTGDWKNAYDRFGRILKPTKSQSQLRYPTNGNKGVEDNG